ncbi:MAG: Mut7-C RNAse domain-containing protein [Gammaproteobacteria bacterium]
MAEVRFRFYEELGDFLPSSRRKGEFCYRLGKGETVKHAIEACGVPHTEVELILANGASVGFDYQPCDADRISVYPQFEAFDITPLLRVRELPLRTPRFIADVHLGALARYLRMLGFDTLYEENWRDAQIAAVSARDRRIVLTRDRDLLMHKIITHGRFVRAIRPRDQLREVVDAVDLTGCISPFTRCMECNSELVRISKQHVQHRLPPDTLEAFTQFSQCGSCARVYWQGSHYRRMWTFIAATFAGNEHRAGTH